MGEKIGEQEIKRILSNWDIGDIHKITLIKEGEVNTNWIIKSSKGKFVLRKVKEERKPSELEFEFLYLSYLKKDNFSYKIPLPLQTKNKKKFLEENGLFWIYNFLEGEFKENCSKKEFIELGKMIAEYHSILKKLKLNNHGLILDNMAVDLVIDELEEFQKNLNDGKIKTKYDGSFMDENFKLLPLLKRLDIISYSQLKKYPIHRDMNPENVLWDGDKIIGVIDFDNVSELNDALIKDVAIILQYCCINKKKLDISKAKSFLEEYQKYRPLSKKEISLIPDILVAAFIEDFSYNFWLIINNPKKGKPQRIKSYSTIAQNIFNDKELIIKNLLN